MELAERSFRPGLTRAACDVKENLTSAGLLAVEARV